MITTKQRAYLRGLANRVPALYQIGKDGINENVVKQTLDALEARELIKFHVLDSAFMTAREAAVELTEATGADVVQVIGNKFVLYKESKDHKQIVLD